LTSETRDLIVLRQVMNEAASLLVAVVGRVVCIKVAGKGNFTCSVDFKKLVAELSSRGYKRFVLDLSECTMMDSTFLGLLAGIGLKFGQKNGEPGDEVVELLNPNPRISDLLENLGVAHLFKIVQSAEPAAECFQPFAGASTPADRAEVTRTCLEAHRTLMDLNPENLRKFKDVAQFLAEDLKKLESSEGQGKR
jgi:anti-sigma B factor antagonist